MEKQLDSSLEGFAIEAIVDRILGKGSEGPKTRMSITIPIDHEYYTHQPYEEAVEFLKKKGVLKNVKSHGEMGTLKGHFDESQELYLYTITFILDRKKFKELLIKKSKIPKYSLRLDSERRLILNDEYHLVTPNFDSTNFHFINYCIVHKSGIIYKENIEKDTRKMLPRFHIILRNLKLSPYLTDIFFPNVAGDCLEFKNDVTQKELGFRVNEKKVNKFIKTLKKIRKSDQIPPPKPDFT